MRIGTSRQRGAAALRMAGIEPFHVMDILARAQALEAAGRGIVHMEIGEPDFDTAAPIVEAGRRALERGDTHYTPAAGIPALREAIAGHYERRYRVKVDPARIIVTPGASGALQLAMAVLVNPGDRVLLADPGYPCNRHLVRLFGGEAVELPVGADDDYQLTADRVHVHLDEKTAAVMLATPSNPTGTLVARAKMADLFAAVERSGARMIVDEIYHGLVYGATVETALSISDEVLVVNSFSKYFGMTGWRLGWLVAPAALTRDIEKLAQNLFLAPSTMAQHAALAAFEPGTTEILEARREAFGQRRDFLLPALRSLGFDVPVEPHGAFYVYADSSRFAADSYNFAMDALETAGVALAPGRDFGQAGAERHLRFAYTTDLAALEEGVSRLERYLSSGATESLNPNFSPSRERADVDS